MAASLLSAEAPGFCRDEPRSLKYTQITSSGGLFGGTLWCRTEYILGRHSRSESRNGVGDRYGPLRAVIRNGDLHCIFHLDLEAKVYTATQVDDRGVPVDARPEQVERKPSGRTRHYHIETVDTGERREMFGRTARHVNTRTTLTMEPPGDSPVTESEIDGWYIDPPAAWLRLYPKRGGFAYLAYGPHQRAGVWEQDEVKCTTAGPRETGFQIVLTDKRGSRHEKVIELSEDALDPALFQPPADFKRVARLPSGAYEYRYPWETRVRLRWLMLMDWL